MEYRKEPIIGFEGYQVDTEGVVYAKNGKPLKPSINHAGYLIVQLFKDGKSTGRSVHTLVATQFLAKENGKTQVNHISGDKTDNNIANLEWVTPKENMRHSVDFLGNCFSVNNNNARGAIGRNKQGDIIYNVDCISDAARIIAKERNITFSAAKNGIWKALSGIRKTYIGLTWNYK